MAAPETPKIDERQAAINHLTKLRDNAITQFQGKLGYNPHLFIKEKITPLLSVLQDPKADTAKVAEAAKAALKVTAEASDVKRGDLPTETPKIPKVPDAAK